MNFFCDYEKYKILYLYLKKDILPNSQYIYNKSKDYKYLSDKYKYKLFGGVLLNEGNIKKENLSEKSSNDFYLADLFKTVEYKDKSVLKTKLDLLQDIIDTKKLNDGNIIGKGSYGTVYKYNEDEKDDKKEYVIKYIEKEPVFARESMNGFQLTKNLQECNILYPLAHYKNHIMYEYGGNDLLVLINYIYKFDIKTRLRNSIIIIKKIAEHLNCMYKAGYAYTDLKYENVVYKEVDEGTPDSIKIEINFIQYKYITIKIIDIDSFVKMEKSSDDMVIKSRITYTPGYNMPIGMVLNIFPYRCPILTGFIAMILLILGIEIGKPFTQLINDYNTDKKNTIIYIKTILLKDIYYILTIFQKQWLLNLITKSISYYDTDRYKNFDEFIDELNIFIEKK